MKRRTAKKTSSPAPASAPERPPLDALNFAAAVEFHRAGQMEKAEILYRAAIALNASHAEAYYNLGVIHHGLGKLPEATAAYRDAIFARIDYVDAYSNLATVMRDQGKMAEAEIFYRQALAYDPTHTLANSNFGVLLNDLKRSDEAKEAFRRAIAVDPAYEWAYVNMASALLNIGEFGNSVASCRRATRLQPDLALAHHNLGAALKAENRIDEAICAFRDAIRARPDFGEAHFALGQVLLMQGRYEEGWPEYDWRWTLPDYGWLRNIHGPFEQPRWRGEDISGKTILLYAEQGLGDAIQYVRYVPALARRAGHVVLAVHPPLLPLFADLEGVDVVALDQVPLPPFDTHCPLMGLGEMFGTRADTIPAEIPYLSAAPAKIEQWRARLGKGGLKVGIVWAGNPTQMGDRWRSPRLAAVAPLFSVPGVQFIALQKGPGRDDLKQIPLPSNVLDLGDEIKDFADTAGIMAGLDLMITSCTAPLHLAAALGVPTWAVIPYAPHFLWQLDRDDSPWYPTLRLYRQHRAGSDWSVPVGRMAEDLRRLAERADRAESRLVGAR
jgi:tetratricopeptide (TPR) repeat protein